VCVWGGDVSSTKAQMSLHLSSFPCFSLRIHGYMRALVYKDASAADIQNNSDSTGRRNFGCQGGRREDTL